MTVFEFAKALVPMGMVISASIEGNRLSVSHNGTEITGIGKNYQVATASEIEEMLADCEDYYKEISNEAP